MSGEPVIATTMAEAEHALLEAAQSHKRAERYHRRQRRELIGQIRLLRERCASLGIELIDNTDPQGGNSGHRNNDG